MRHLALRLGAPATLLALSLTAACSSGTGASGDTTGAGTTQTAGGLASVWLVTSAPLAHSSLEDSAARALRQLPGVRGEVLESSPSRLPQDNIATALAHRPALVLAPPFEGSGYNLWTLAGDHPRQRFGVISDSRNDPPPNVSGYWIDVHESSYLAGLAAGGLTRTREVGAVLGFLGPAINQFFYGFEQGVLASCPSCTVTSADLGFDFDHPAHGRQAAEKLFRHGADIVFNLAGQSGLGVLQAAAKPGRFAIGVDADQDAVVPGHVIVSVLKRTDLTTAALVRSALDNTFDGGHVKHVGLAGGYSDLSWSTGSHVFRDRGPHALVRLLPAVMRDVDRARRDIFSGRVVVCDALNDPASQACSVLAAPS